MSVAEDETDDQVMLVLTRMQQFPTGSREYKRIQAIWHRASFSGALRNRFPKGTESIKAEWSDLVAESLAAIV